MEISGALYIEIGLPIEFLWYRVGVNDYFKHDTKRFKAAVISRN